MKKILLNILLLLTLSSCDRYYWEFELGVGEFDEDILQYIESETGLNLPEKIVGLNYRYKPPIDPAFIAKFEIPSDEINHIIDQVSDLKDEDYSSSGGLTTKVNWWFNSDSNILHQKKTILPTSVLEVTITKERTKTILYIDYAIF